MVLKVEHKPLGLIMARKVRVQQCAVRARVVVSWRGREGGREGGQHTMHTVWLPLAHLHTHTNKHRNTRGYFPCTQQTPTPKNEHQVQLQRTPSGGREGE